MAYPTEPAFPYMEKHGEYQAPHFRPGVDVKIYIGTQIAAALVRRYGEEGSPEKIASSAFEYTKAFLREFNNRNMDI